MRPMARLTYGPANELNVCNETMPDLLGSQWIKKSSEMYVRVGLNIRSINSPHVLALQLDN